MAEESKYLLEPLRREADFNFYRGRERGNEMPILAVAVAAEQPSPRILRRLEYEYSLATELDAAWAAQPLALTHHRRRAVLILRDPGGEPLDRVIEQHSGQPIDLTHFLHIAIGLAAALGQAHRQGLIHKDLKPENVLVDDSGHAWLTGFGIASRLPRERQTPTSPEIIAGTLAYMSPEQTGRMNRSIDTRSDLYSLGVTLYQILTGALPFSAVDPLEWIHCHIARQPIAPIDRRTVPEPLSAIIIKLLAKNAEDRYQTAAGLEADLRRCLTEWRSHGRINSFPLGTDDVSDRLLIPERLYGREREVNALLAAFDRIVAGGKPELVLVSGYSGIGKSAIVNELHKVLVPPRGLFASGKFDQYKRDIPYATLAQAFQTLIHPLLSESEEELSKWRVALHEALDPNGQLMLDLVPELKLIIGEQPPVAELLPQEAQGRFQLVFRRFIGVFARPEHPLALFLDDLQWLDAATLDLMEDLLTQTDVQHLMLIGAYRDNEVDPTHPLMRKLEAMRQAGAIVQDIVLTPLAREALERLVSDSLHCEPERVAPLAQLVHDKTAGNPFFAIQFISSLAEEGLLAFDHGEGRWSWDLNRILAKGYTDNVVDLMVGKLSRLPAETQKALRHLACLGDSAEFTLLGIVYQNSNEEMHGQLWEAVRAGLIFRSENSYRFLHDRVQEAAYSLIPQELRAEAHLRIGRLLATQTPPERWEETIFEIVNQLNRGAHLIVSTEERERVAELNLIAGRRAKTATAYASALSYVSAGAGLLSDEAWERRHELIFSLELNRAECEFLTGQLAAADARLSILSSRAANTLELAAVACLGVDLYTTLDQSDRAVAACLDYLRHVGIEWSPHPTEEEARREYERIWTQLGSRAIEDVIDSPLMTDPGSLATLDVLTKVVAPAWFTDPNLGALAICKAVNLSIQHGNSDGSCSVYVELGMIAGPHFGNYKVGSQFGRLGYDLVEKCELKRFKAGTYLSFGVVIPWTSHIRTGRDLVRRAFDAANEIGDLTFAAFSCNQLNTNLLAAGDPLVDVQREAEKGLAFARKARFGLVIDIITPQVQLVRTLRGLTPRCGCFSDEGFDELGFESHLSTSQALAPAEFSYWVRKVQGRFLAGDYASAVDASSKAYRLRGTSPSFFEAAEYQFYTALSQAALWDSACPDEKRQHFEALATHHKQLEVWAEHCPENFENRAALVGAEIARLEGRVLDAEGLYEQAIRSAHANGFIHNEAVAWEVAARFYAARGFDKIADVYLLEARYCYLRWGADGKVRQLEERYPHLREGRTSATAASIGVQTAQLDAETVVKASQAISIEIILPRLIENLIRIAMEHAGAERGLLVLIEDNEPRIEAVGSTGQLGIEVVVRRELVTPSSLPQSVLQFVLRTKERVLLDDASIDSVYSEDEYVRQNSSRSILCLPIVRQAQLSGALYLENNLSSFVFTPDRVTVLQLLASQAAISLENASLYTDLQLQVGLLQQLPVSAWTLKPDGTPDFVNRVWLEFAGQTLEFVRSHPEAWMNAVHPEDREYAAKSFWEGVNSGQGFAFETRFLRARDGTYRRHLDQAVVLRDAKGKVIKFVGTTTDIEDQKRTEEALRQAQSDLARINRVTTMGELAASLAHELSQPISGAIINANVGMKKLGSETPNLDEVRGVFARIARDAQRAAEIISRVRSQFEKGAPNQESLNLNKIIPETITLLRDEAVRHSILVRTELADELPQVVGDRVQLQQVMMNLILNSIEAMKDVDGMREIVIRSQRSENEQILVSFSDTGIGLPPEWVERIFDAFFTTKSHGTGMGLRISRSIIEAHGGRLWAVPSERGATFQFTLPAVMESQKRISRSHR